MVNARLPKVALRWTPPGKRKQDEARATWRTVLSVQQKIGYTLGKSQHVAKNGVKCRELVAALRPTQDGDHR